MSKRWVEIFKFVGSILICQGAGAIGSIFTSMSVNNWYQAINKPSFRPPDWVFSPVWITLFFLMGVALYLIWRRGFDEPGVKMAMVVFFIHLGLNILWSALFFGMRSPLLGFIEIIVLWIFIVVTLWLFWRVSRWAGILLIPYLLWVSFASVLNYYLWVLNM